MTVVVYCLNCVNIKKLQFVANDDLMLYCTLLNNNNLINKNLNQL